MQPIETVKFLLGLGDWLADRPLVFDALRMACREARCRRDEACTLCGRHPCITALQDAATAEQEHFEPNEAIIGFDTPVPMTENSGMNVFCYGTLLLPEIMARVTGRHFRSDSGRLRGYVRLRVRDEMYPAILPFPDTHTDGVVYYDVDESSLQKLDAFEGALYRRTSVNIETESGEWVEAEAYVIRLNSRNRLTADAWDETEFRLKHLKKFLESYPGFTT